MIEDSTPIIELEDEAEQDRPPYWRGREPAPPPSDTAVGQQAKGSCSPAGENPSQGLLEGLQGKAAPLVPPGERGTLESISFSVDLLASLVSDKLDSLEVTSLILSDTVEGLAERLIEASERQAAALEALAELSKGPGHG